MIGLCVLSWSRVASPVPPRRWGPAGELRVSHTASRLGSMWWGCWTAGSSWSWMTPTLPCSLLHVTATENRGGGGGGGGFCLGQKPAVLIVQIRKIFCIYLWLVWVFPGRRNWTLEHHLLENRPNGRFVFTCGVQTQTKTTQMVNRDRGTKDTLVKLTWEGKGKETTDILESHPKPEAWPHLGWILKVLYDSSSPGELGCPWPLCSAGRLWNGENVFMEQQNNENRPVWRHANDLASCLDQVHFIPVTISRISSSSSTAACGTNVRSLFTPVNTAGRFGTVDQHVWNTFIRPKTSCYLFVESLWAGN